MPRVTISMALIVVLAGTFACEKPSSQTPKPSAAKDVPPKTHPNVSKREDPLKADLAKLKPGEVAGLFNGRDLTGWKVLTEGYFDLAGKVYVEDGTLVLGAGNQMTGVQWTGSALRDNFRIYLEAKRVEGDDFFCGLTFPVGEGYVTLILGGWSGSVVGLSNVDHLSAVDNNTTQIIEFKKNTWYSVEARVAGGKVRIWLDGELIIDQETTGRNFDVWPQQEPARPIGITTYSTKGAIRDIYVEHLAKAPASISL